MRTNIISIVSLALCSLVAFSCAKEMAENGKLTGTTTFHAYDAEANDQTKTTLSGTSVLWNPGDQIMVYQGTTSSGKFTSTATETCSATDFTGTLPYIIGSQETSPEASNIWAVYPYSAACGCDGSSVTIKVDAEQTAQEGTFASGIFPSVAKSNSYSLAFYNVCGGVKFTVAQSGIQKVIFRGNASENLAGKVKVSFSEGLPTVGEITEAVDSVIVNAPNTDGFVPGKEYFIVTLPSALNSGYKLTFVGQYDNVNYSTTNSAEIKRKTFGVLQEKDKVGILFRDAEAKAACVEKFDTNEDGEVSFTEATVPTTLDGLFENHSEVQYFPELQYFTSIKDLKGCFNGCSYLAEIEIPEFIDAIGDKSFYGCSSLAEIEIPSSVKSIEAKAFYGCSAFTEISIPSSIQSIGAESFRNCTSLSYIDMSEGVKTLGSMAFYGIGARTITLPSTVVEIGTKTFWNEVEDVFMKGIIPPSRSELSFGTSTYFYVPDDAVNTYRNADIWTYFSECIFAESEYIAKLDLEGTSNCYIVNKPGNYSFNATVKGGSTESVGIPVSASVLWETFGTDVTPTVGDIIKRVSLSDDNVIFSTPSTLHNGNAVIAVSDGAGNILWSWHIWVCKDYDPVKTAQIYNNGAGILMDRNIGATSAAPGDVHALGLLFQWGRKDPFLSSSKINDNCVAASTLIWPESVTSDQSTGTIQYAVSHPTSFITMNGKNKDWNYTGTTSTDETRWKTFDSDKGVYDPCPAGWRVPEGGSNGVWSKAFGSSTNYYSGPWDDTNYGFNFGLSNGHSLEHQLGTDDIIWYPTAGVRGNSSGELVLRRETNSFQGGCWSCTGSDCLTFDYDGEPYYGTNQGYVRPAYSYWKANGYSVRCCKD